MAREKSIKKTKSNSNANLPKDILKELKEDNISFSDHIYREKYASIEGEEEENDLDGLSHEERIIKATEEQNRINQIRLNIEEKELEDKKKYENQKLHEENSLKKLIEKNNGNEDKAIKEFREFMESQGHDSEKIEEELLAQAKKIDDDKKSDRKFEKKQTKESEKQNRKDEIANMAMYQRAFGHFKYAYDRTLGKVVNGVANSVSYGFGWFLLILIIFLILFSLTYGVYTAQSDECQNLQDTTKGGWSRMFSIWRVWPIETEFSNCVWDNFWSGFGNFLKNINFIKPIMVMFDDSVNTATGGMYYSQFDKNAKEPTGLFIRNTDQNKKSFYIEEPIQISADLDVKTIDSKLTGTIQGYLLNTKCTEIYPPAGILNIEKDISESFTCKYPPNTFTETVSATPFVIEASFWSKNIAYIKPTFIKNSVWSKYSDNQKRQLQSSSNSNKLIDTNSPMRIAGKFGSNSDGIVKVNDYNEHLKTDIKELKINLQSGEDNGKWTNGQVEEINKLIIILPSSLTIQSDQAGKSDNKFKACGYYNIEKISQCSNLNLEDNSYSDFLCKEEGNIYSFIQDENPEMQESFNTRTNTITCQVVINEDELFKNNDLATGLIDDKGIKIYSEYKYSVSKKIQINLQRKLQRLSKSITTTTCPIDIKKYFQGKTIGDLNIENKFEYSTRYQNLFEKFVSTVDNNKEPVYEALMAAITEKYNNFKIKTESETITTYSGQSPTPYTVVGRFLTGCLMIGGFTSSSNVERDIGCLFTQLKNIIEGTNKVEGVDDPTKILETYYRNSVTKTNNGQEQHVYSEQATREDYDKWLYALCDKTSWKADLSNEEHPVG